VILLEEKKKKIEDLKNKYSDCTKCPNAINNKKVFGHGNLNAKIVVVGEGPEEAECKQGIPFVGIAGQLLDKILLSIEIKREDIFATNTVVCRTNTSNRIPTETECSNCRQRLFEELLIVSPQITILAGNSAIANILGADHRTSKDHGEWITTLTKPCVVCFPIYHPSWILHSATEGETKKKKLTMWHDILKFKEEMEVISEFNL